METLTQEEVEAVTGAGLVLTERAPESRDGFFLTEGFLMTEGARGPAASTNGFVLTE